MILLKSERCTPRTGKGNFIFSGRDPFPLFLKKNKLPKRFSIAQPGELGESDYYKESDIEVKWLLMLAFHDIVGLQ